jgi:fibro-slime domain-containing protein
VDGYQKNIRRRKQMRRFLFVLLALALAMGLFIPMAAPAAAAEVGDTIDLPVTIRDFHGIGWGSPGPDGYYQHPDFEDGIIVDPGIVQTTLGMDGKPVYEGDDNPSVHGQTAFDQWYRDNATVNQTLETFLTFTFDGSNYVYENPSFFPIDSLLLGNDGRTHNYHFTMELHTSFTYEAGQSFSFTGDDDLWLFINDQLVIDLGGVHAALSASIDLDTLGLTEGELCSFDLFFAERHTTESNFNATTNIALAPPTYDICGFKYAEFEGERIPLPNWEIILEEWVNGVFWDWIPVDSTITDENGRYCFTDLPAGTYRVSETLKEGWDQVSPEGSHEVTLPTSIVYGIQRYTGDVYGVDVPTGTSWLEFEMPTPPGANSASPNGLAYNPENGYLYYTDYQLGTTPDTLYFWDGTAQGVAGQIAAGTVACGDIYNGKYYYIPSNTDDLYEVTFNPDGTIDTDTKLGDISAGEHRWTFDGDIAVKDGVVYGWGRCQVGGHGFEFFTYDLTGGAFNFTKPAYQQSLQLAFGLDGILYGHRSGTGGPFYAVDTTDGGVTLVSEPEPDNEYTDCASGQSLYNFINTPTLYCFDETAWAAEVNPGDNRFVDPPGNWATWIDYDVGEGTETDPVVFKLYAGQTYYAGDLLVWDNSTTLFAKYIASGEAGDYAPVGYCGGTWTGLTEYHLQVVDDYADFEAYRVYNKKKAEYGAPIPGSFDTIWEGDKVAETDPAIEIDISGLWEEGNVDLFIAAHAVMWWCGYDCDALNELHLQMLRGTWYLEVNNSTYDHDMFIVSVTPTGELTGYGGYPAGSGPTYPFPYNWTLVGQVTGFDVEMTLSYQDTYTATITGTIAPTWDFMSGGAGTGGVTNWTATKL